MKPAAFSTVLLLAACGSKADGPKKPDPNAVDPTRMAELGLLMKNDINPAFSKLSFLVLHGDGEDTDRTKLKAEIQASAATLRKGIGRLRVWQHPPTVTNQGRDVFYSFASSIDTSLQRFEEAIGKDDVKTVVTTLEQITKTCENCHHFFRIDVAPTESPVSPQAPPPVDPK